MEEEKGEFTVVDSSNYSIVTAASNNMLEADYKIPRAVPGEKAQGTSHTDLDKRQDTGFNILHSPAFLVLPAGEQEKAVGETHFQIRRNPRLRTIEE